MTNPHLPQGYREVGVVTPQKLRQAEATLEWLEANVFRYEGNPKDLMNAARAEVTRMREEFEEKGESQAAGVIEKIRAGTRNIT